MVRNGRIAIGEGVEPDLVASGCLPVKCKSKGLQSPDDLSITESSQPPQLRTYYDGVIQVFGGRRKGDGALSLAARFNQLPRHVTRNLQCFSDGPPLCDEPGEFV
jgi:hypothetical protein